MINAGGHMPGFGGSRTGLTVGKTASLVVRNKNTGSATVSDTEYDIHDPNVWAAVARWVNDCSGEIKAEATAAT